MNNLTVHWKPILQAATDYPNGRLYAIAISLVIIILLQYWQNTFSFPTYGGIWSFSRTLSALRLKSKEREQCLEAYAKHPIMLVPRNDAWTALAHSKYVEEISSAPNDVLSSLEAAVEVTQARWTRSSKFMKDQYHFNVISQLTRNLTLFFPDILDETKLAVNEYAGNTEGWHLLNVYSFSQKVIARASNRIYVGKSLCRDEEWLSLVIRNAVDIMTVAEFINSFPRIVRPIVGWLSSPGDAPVNNATKICGPTIQKKIDECRRGTSNDYLSWLIDIAPEYDRNTHGITARVLSTNFVSIHGMARTLTNGLYWLMARPEYWEPLREEVEVTTSRLGWTKDAIGAMVKLDSFLRECMRITPTGTQVLGRKVRKPFTFSNGFTAPVGMIISAHLYATHHDESIYPRADEFDGFRFIEAEPSAGHDEKEKGTGPKKTMSSTSPVYLVWGHGKHACPGRFFGTLGIKLAFAYIIANYDMKWPDSVYNESVPGYTTEGYRPPDLCFGHRMMPDRTPKMLIRKRVDACE